VFSILGKDGMMALTLLTTPTIPEDLRLARLPDLIRRLMDERDLTWTELADKANLPRSTAHVIGMGRLKNPPKPEHLEALAEALRVPPRMLKEAAARDYGLTQGSGATVSDESDEEARLLIATYEQLSEERKAELVAIARTLLGLTGPSPRRKNKGRPRKGDQPNG
jgi:transcriptional regulator with XRE-family HTH domain